ncbi:mucin-5AC-like [Oscarella lobularis]|uniref:mucin-5AC-like n=1 Tax=Oscarella lobularis TaxID=121494 RepID=UPI003313A3F2
MQMKIFLLQLFFFICYEGALSQPQGCWTNWFDRDNPGGTGDWELLSDYYKEGYNLCFQPKAVRCRTKNTHKPYSSTGESVTCTLATGLICKNQDQSPGKFCSDYEVSFLCPCCWTRWFDIDDPSATGDWELLRDNPNVCREPSEIRCRKKYTNLGAHLIGEIHKCSLSYGFSCRNSEQPGYEPGRTMCSDYEVSYLCPCNSKGCWTDWLDRDDPSGTGDWEPLNDFRKEKYDVCSEPPEAKCRRTFSHQNALSTGQTLTCSKSGLVCKNRDQHLRFHWWYRYSRCYDYEVSFHCPCCWSKWIDIDDPSGVGDYEIIEALRNLKYDICSHPVAIRCRTKKTQIDSSVTGEKLICSPTLGLSCRNSHQPGRKGCSDYEVSLLCPCTT